MASEPEELPDRWLTIPNLLSVIRLALVPVFLWLLLGPKADGWALAILVYSGVSDWADGKIARWLNQASKLGAILDPAADRLYTLATVVAFVLRDIIPLWFALVLVGRDLIVGVCIWVLRRNGFGPPEVTYIGKAATFNLMYAMPLLLLAQGGSDFATIVRPCGLRVRGLGRRAVRLVRAALPRADTRGTALTAADPPHLSFGQTPSAEEMQ